jgi:anti-anti-sigma regulatory factor
MHNSVELTSASPSITIVSLIGDHDLGDYKSLKIAFARATIRAPNVIADLERCSFIDSTVVSLLFHAHRVVASDGGSFGVALPTERNDVTRVSELMQLPLLVPTHASLAEALASVEQEQFAGVRAGSFAL